jgi:hypothetical protein
MAGATGLEPAASGVTGRRSNRLSYAPGAFGELRPPRAQVKQRASADLRRLFDSNQDGELLAHVVKDRRGSNADEFGFAFSPCQGPHLIGQDDAGHATASRQRNLERIALALVRDRAGGAQSGPFVIGAARENDRGTAAPLLMSLCRIEFQPHNIAGIGATWLTRPRCRAAVPNRFPSADFPS